MFEYMIQLIMDYLMWLSEGDIDGDDYWTTVER
jgi:hypothetical protein